jgi:hypothetical protein
MPIIYLIISSNGFIIFRHKHRDTQKYHIVGYIETSNYPVVPP